MGSLQSWHRNKHIIISLLLLSVSSFIHIISMAEGRAIPKPPLETTKVQETRSSIKALTVHNTELGEKKTSRIGSRPPSCRKRCRNCSSHCEAVEVPVILHDSQNQRRRRSSSHLFDEAAKAAVFEKSIGLAGEDQTSNYKPMSWKCKCGNFIFDP